MGDVIQFEAFKKIPRLSRDIVVTEKIDGTNAQVLVREYDGLYEDGDSIATVDQVAYVVRAGSRNRWIKPGDDNFGFACWVRDNAQELARLGEGSHYGEWWGQGIQRGYGLTNGDKRFSLFNTGRWFDTHSQVFTDAMADSEPWNSPAPACCHVVPALFAGDFQQASIDSCLLMLREEGSMAAPGFMKPEGVVIYHTAAGQYFKKTIEGDESPKGKAA